MYKIKGQKKHSFLSTLFLPNLWSWKSKQSMTVHFKNTAWGGGGGELDPSKEFIENNLSRGPGLFCLWAVGKQVMRFLRAFIQNSFLYDFQKLWSVQMLANGCLYVILLQIWD